MISKHIARVAGVAFSVLVSTLVACSSAQTRKTQYVARGDEYFAAKQYDKARVEYSNALQIDPKDASARFHSGQVAERLGKPSDAVDHYQSALELNPDLASARAALGRLYLLAGLPDKASEIVDPGLKSSPDEAALRTVRGAIRSRSGNTAGALEDAEAAIARDPDDEYTVALLVSLYRQQGRTADAIQLLTAELEKKPHSVDLRIILADLQYSENHPAAAEAQLRKIVDFEPATLANWQRLAQLQLMTRNVDGAEQTMRDALKAVPGNVDTKLALVELLAAQRGNDRAEQQILQFLKQEPGNTELQLALGRYYEASRDSAKAETTYRSVIAREGLKSPGLDARNRIATMLLQRSDTTGAQKLIAEVLAVNPRDSEALVLRGNLAMSRGDTAAAIADLRAVLRDQPNALVVMRALARAHLQNGEASLAEDTLRNAVQVNPRDQSARSDLATLLLQTGKPEQAQTLLVQLAADAPTDIMIRESLFRAQLSQLKFADAHTTATEIGRLRPDLPLGAYFAGLVNEGERKIDAAEADYERALQIKADAAEPLTALVRLDLARHLARHALARLDAVIQKLPDNALARNLQGEVLLSTSQFDAAARSFERAIAMSPAWWLPYRGLAMAQFGAKRVDDAVASMNRGVQKTGSDELAANLAALNERLGRSDDAIKVYENAIVRNPRSLSVANNLAMMLVTHRTDKVSLDRAQLLVEMLSRSSDPSFMDTRGWVRLKRGETQAAVTLLQQAVDKAPQSQEFRYHLGMAQYRSGNRVGAQINLEAALRKGTGFAGAEEARATLIAINGKS